MCDFSFWHNIVSNKDTLVMTWCRCCMSVLRALGSFYSYLKTKLMCNVVHTDIGKVTPKSDINLDCTTLMHNQSIFLIADKVLWCQFCRIKVYFD